MVLGHAACALLARRFAPRLAADLPLCLLAAYGPDWCDKPLKMAFGLSGHGIGHSLIGSALLLFLFRLACRRWGLPASWPAVAVGFWALHLLCDAPGTNVLFWPFFGAFPLRPEGTFVLALSFYGARPLGTLAWLDIVLTLLAGAAWLWPAGRLAPRRPAGAPKALSGTREGVESSSVC